MATNSGTFSNFMNMTPIREFGRGVGETLGFDYGTTDMISKGYNIKDGQSIGWMGRNTPTRNLVKGERLVRTLDKTGGLHGTGGMMGQGKGVFAGRILGLAFVGYTAFQGYQEGGAWGATKAVAQDAAQWGAMRAGWSIAKGALANPFIAVPAVAGAMGYAGYKVGEAAKDHARRLRNVEMGAEVIDRFGTLATIRQRSLMSLNNSHMNGRLALGNEGTLLHSQYMR